MQWPFKYASSDKVGISLELTVEGVMVICGIRELYGILDKISEKGENLKELVK